MAAQFDDHHSSGHDEPVALVVSQDEARAIDAWSAAHHIGDRAQAIHRLVHIALDADADLDDAHLR